jgi:putative glycosyltransferase (TIGR04372 family)
VILNLFIFNLKKIKLIFQNILKKVLFKLGYDIYFNHISKFEIELSKFKKLKKNKKLIKYEDQKKAFNKIKRFPGPQMFKEWEEIIIEWEHCKVGVFKKLENFYSLRKRILDDMELSKLNIDFISKEIFTGSFGMPYHFHVYNEAKLLKLHNAKTICLLDEIIYSFKKKWSITNNTLFNYLKPFLKLISNKKEIKSFANIEKYLNVPISLAVPINEKYMMVEIAKNIINTKKYEKKITKPTLLITERHKFESKEMLKKIGIDLQNDWFVTLHAREPGYAEKNSDREFFRNGNIEDYNLAIDHIIKSGGKVVRVGDSSMTKINEKKGLIDYAHSDFKSEKLDILLAANSRFCIATSSGFFAATSIFDIPVILTNTSHSVVYYRLKKNDFYVPALLKKKNEKNFLKLTETMFPPFSIVNVDVKERYKDWNIEYFKNSPEDILFATEEMIERLNSNNFDELKKLQSEIRDKLNLKQNIYSSERINHHGIFPEKFLKKHIEII